MVDVIFVPQGAEARAVRRSLARARVPVRVVPMGIGARAAARAATSVLGAGVRGALVTGLCGLLSPAFAVGDALLYREVRRDAERPLALEQSLGDELASRLPELQTGIRALESETIVTRAAQKRALGARFGLDAVDMETFALATSLQRAGIACAALRVASDGVDDDLPDLNRALDGSGGIDGFALALAMLRRPRAAVALARHGTRALARLEAAVYAVVRPAAS